jgi:heme-degrading monooxygenase HmoA
MIARVWHGVTGAEKADQYLDYLKATGVKEISATEGNQGVQILRQTNQGHTEFLFISFWESWDAIRRFAGDDVNTAVYYPEDKEFLLALEPQVAHYEVGVLFITPANTSNIRLQ